jgi:succinate-semialdehyde dehydrogenase/glutarate-semialdehyde dehydrogenase
VPDQRETETHRAIDAAVLAYKTWGVSGVKYRQGLLVKWFNLMNEYADELAEIITLENGKPIAEAKGEVAYSASFIEWYVIHQGQANVRFAHEAVRMYGDTIPSAMDGVRNVTIRQPVGVVGVITPWNC